MGLGSNGWTHTALYAAVISALLPLSSSAQVAVGTTAPIALPGQFTFEPVARMGTSFRAATERRSTASINRR